MDNELYHHGIKGQKWGVIRTKAQLGYPTTKKKTTRERVKSIDARSRAKAKKIIKEGREQAKIDKAKAKADARIKKAQDKVKRRNGYGEDTDTKTTTSTKNESATKPSSSKPKSISEMSNEELAAATQRLNLERMYKQAYNDLNPAPKQVEKGQNFAKKFLNEAIKPAAITVGKDVLTKFATKQASKLLGLDEKKVKDEMEALKKEADELGLKSKIASAKKNINEVNKYFDQEEKDKQNQSKSTTPGRRSFRIKRTATAERVETPPSYDNYTRDRFVNATVENVRSEYAGSASVGEDYVRRNQSVTTNNVTNESRNSHVVNDTYSSSNQSVGEEYVRRYLGLGSGS